MKLASKFKTATVLGAVCAAFAVPAHAEFTGSAGLGVHVWDGGFRDTDAQVWPIPAVDVETDHFYFKGLEAGGFLVKTDAHRLMLGVSYMGLGFDAGDSDDARMKKLDDRDGSFFANVTYAWRSQLGQITASIGADISGKSEGFMSDVSWMKRFDVAGFGVTAGRRSLHERKVQRLLLRRLPRRIQAQRPRRLQRRCRRLPVLPSDRRLPHLRKVQRLR